MGGVDVAGAEEGGSVRALRLVAVLRFESLCESLEEGPFGEAGVFLFDGAAVDGDGGEFEGAGFGEDLFEAIGGFLGFIEGAAQFDGEQAGDGIADAAHDEGGGIGVGEHVTAAATAHDFFNRAGEIEVDDVEAGLDEEFGGAGHFVGFAAHQLSGDGMILVAEDGTFFETAAATEEDLIEECFGDGVGAAAAAGDDAHGHIGITCEAGLHGGEGEFKGADVDGAECGRGRGGRGNVECLSHDRAWYQKWVEFTLWRVAARGSVNSGVVFHAIA